MVTDVNANKQGGSIIMEGIYVEGEGGGTGIYSKSANLSSVSCNLESSEPIGSRGVSNGDANVGLRSQTASQSYI